LSPLFRLEYICRALALPTTPARFHGVKFTFNPFKGNPLNVRSAARHG
jgi:hypothetical protein